MKTALASVAAETLVLTNCSIEPYGGAYLLGTPTFG
jgi:hypothetical protein